MALIGVRGASDTVALIEVQASDTVGADRGAGASDTVALIGAGAPTRWRPRCRPSIARQVVGPDKQKPAWQLRGRVERSTWGNALQSLDHIQGTRRVRPGEYTRLR